MRGSCKERTKKDALRRLIGAHISLGVSELNSIQQCLNSSGRTPDNRSLTYDMILEHRRSELLTDINQYTTSKISRAHDSLGVDDKLPFVGFVVCKNRIAEFRIKLHSYVSPELRPVVIYILMLSMIQRLVNIIPCQKSSLSDGRCFRI